MKKIKGLFILCLLVLIVTGCSVFTVKNKKIEYLSGKHYVEMSIKDYGKLEFELDADVAPITVTNFINLVRSGLYNNNKIIRVQKDFVIQAGTGTGNEETIKGEFLANGVDNTISHEKGVISMARGGDTTSGYDTASSQFFIVTGDNAKLSLDNYYAAFGKVIKGMEIIDKINKAKLETGDMGFITNESNMPIIEYIKEIEK